MRTVWIEGFLYAYTALVAALLTYISGEDAYKYIDPVALFWLKSILGSTVAAANGLKAYRSMTFARHVQQPDQKP